MTRKLKKSLPGLFFLLLLSAKIWAQSNNECSGAIVISDPSDYCTPDGTDNSVATASPQAFPSCWSNVNRDLWYTFTAVAPDLVIIIKGQTPSNPLGTLIGPQVAVYSGTCGSLNELGCAIDVNFNSNLPLAINNLVIGQQYYIRVDGILPGQFQCCIQNKVNVSVVSGDCPTGTFICSKNPIQVEQVFGPGNDPFEVNSAPCFSGTGESSSAWYIFTAANNGILDFTLTPNDPIDDLDFVVYRLPNGPGDCTGKVIERCMGAGDLDPASPCMGPTGLSPTGIGISHPFGCFPGDVNFLQSLTLVSGETYALVVNDYTTVGNGFSIEWGGSSLFKGDISVNFATDEPDQKICLGEALVVTDSSTATVGVLTNWSWDFGNGAVADSVTGPGPLVVQYQTIGPKQIILTVLNDEGCSSQDTAFIVVETCCTFDATVNVMPGCPGDPATAATATVAVENALDPLSVNWSTGQTGISAEINTSGTYSVVVTDATGCTDSLSFVVNTPLNVSAMFPPDTTEILEGQTLTLSVTGNPTDSLKVFWIAEGDTLFGAVQLLSPTETITYWVVVDNSGCVFTDSITIVVEKPKFERPNAFTPNGDGSNDTFGPVLIGHTLVQLEVWSRWGEKVFDSIVDGKNTWDGTINGLAAPSDVYVYRVRVLLVEGTEKVEKGDITLLR
jgi:gliding motility-associated-like protein